MSRWDPRLRRRFRRRIPAEQKAKGKIQSPESKIQNPKVANKFWLVLLPDARVDFGFWILDFAFAFPRPAAGPAGILLQLGRCCNALYNMNVGARWVAPSHERVDPVVRCPHTDINELSKYAGLITSEVPAPSVKPYAPF